MTDSDDLLFLGKIQISGKPLNNETNPNFRKTPKLNQNPNSYTATLLLNTTIAKYKIRKLPELEKNKNPKSGSPQQNCVCGYEESRTTIRRK